MKKAALLLSIYMTLLSCKRDASLTFLIANETPLKIDSLCIEPNSKRNEEKFISIPISGTQTYIVNFRGLEKTDGSYRIDFKKGGQTFHETFGYYSNGTPMEKQIVIHIREDGIIYNNLYN